MIPETTTALIAVGCTLIGFAIGGGWGWNAGQKAAKLRAQSQQEKEPENYKVQNMRTMYGKDFKNDGVMYNAISSRISNNGEAVVITGRPEEIKKKLKVKLKEGETLEFELLNPNDHSYKFFICVPGKK